MRGEITPDDLGGLMCHRECLGESRHLLGVWGQEEEGDMVASPAGKPGAKECGQPLQAGKSQGRKLP